MDFAVKQGVRIKIGRLKNMVRIVNAVTRRASARIATLLGYFVFLPSGYVLRNTITVAVNRFHSYFPLRSDRRKNLDY